MAASEHTQYYNLPVYQADDKTSWLTDFNGAMEKIDTAIHEAAQSGGGSSINVVQTTGESELDVMSQNAVTNALQSNKTSLEEQISAKQDQLISGTNMKTVNGQSLLGQGNVDVASASPSFLKQFTISKQFNGGYKNSLYKIPANEIPANNYICELVMDVRFNDFVTNMDLTVYVNDYNATATVPVPQSTHIDHQVRVALPIVLASEQNSPIDIGVKASNGGTISRCDVIFRPTVVK